MKALQVNAGQSYESLGDNKKKGKIPCLVNKWQ